LDKGGQHSESYWGKRFWVPMTDLYNASWIKDFDSMWALNHHKKFSSNVFVDYLN
jgi:hypothetical protein